MKIVFVDLDDTLVDTSGFKDKMFSSVGVLSGLPVGKINKLYEDLRVDGQLSERWLSAFVKKVSIACGVSERSLTDAVYGLIPTMKLKRKLLHFSKGVSTAKYILTVGDKQFQKAKIDHFGLARYFDGIVYVRGLKCDFIRSNIHGKRLKISGKYYDDVEIIDDKTHLLGDLREFDFIKIRDPNDIK